MDQDLHINEEPDLDTRVNNEMKKHKKIMTLITVPDFKIQYLEIRLKEEILRRMQKTDQKKKLKKELQKTNAENLESKKELESFNKDFVQQMAWSAIRSKVELAVSSFPDFVLDDNGPSSNKKRKSGVAE